MFQMHKAHPGAALDYSCIPSGTIDGINPLVFPGVLRRPALNMGIQLQRCRDFEEHGFCLRGDMCPMEHGVNRIVVEDVQLLSIKRKINLEYVASKVVLSNILDSIVTVGYDLKLVTSDSPKVPPVVQKKKENLELLEVLRKKQEMLGQKCNEFRRQLDQLAKQATGVKGEVSAGQAAKRYELEASADGARNTKSANAIISKLSLQPEAVVNTVNEDSTVCQRPEPNSVAAPRDSLSFQRTGRPVAAFGFLFHINRYKLDNRPKSFKISAPLPAGWQVLLL